MSAPAADPRGTQARVDRLVEIPTLSSVVAEALRALDDDESSTADLGRILSQDSALTAKLLRIANSTVFNPSGKPTHSVTVALSRIGFSEARNLVLSVGVVGAFGPKGFPVDYVAFWKHSLATAHAARAIAHVAPALGSAAAGEHAFVAGLLHDVGIVALGASLGEPYARVFQVAKRESHAIDVVEQTRLGVAHPAIGERVLSRWGVPAAICAAVAHHARPDRAAPSAQPLAYAVHLADVLAEQHVEAARLETTPPSLRTETHDRLGLDPWAEEQIVRHFSEELAGMPLLGALGAG